jgi:hypothetical protein
MLHNDKIIEAIISVGINSTIKDEFIPLLSNLSEYNIENKIRIDDLDLRNALLTFSNENLINIFRGLVIIGNYFNWGVNSGSEAIFIYRHIIKRKLDRDLKIADWAFLNSQNPYIPFGSAGNIRHSSRDAYDYVRNSGMQYSLDLTQEVVEKIDGYSSYLDQRTIEELKVANEILQRKITDLEADTIKLKFEKENLKIRLLLSEKTSIDKAQFIIKDTIRPVYFYSKEIEQIIEDKQVNKSILTQLQNLFKDEENQHNKTLKIKIMNKINNR